MTTEALLYGAELDLKYLTGVSFLLRGLASTYLLWILLVLLPLELTCHSGAGTSHALSVVLNHRVGIPAPDAFEFRNTIQ